MKHFSYLAFLIFLSTFSFKSVSQSLEEELKPYLKNLNSNTYFYHYFNSSFSSNFIENERNRSLLAHAIVKSRAKQFWNLNNHRTQFAVAGQGLYLAIDPFISSPQAKRYTGLNFGKSQIRLTIRKNSTYLDILNPIKLSENTLKLLIEKRVLTKRGVKYLLKNGSFSQKTLRKMMKKKYTKFRMFVNAIFLKNKVVMIEYKWKSALSYLCEIEKMKIGILYIGSDLSNILNISLIESSLLNSKELLSADELELYLENQYLKNTLKVLKRYERRSKITSAKSYLMDRYNSVELAKLRSNHFKCGLD